MAESENYKILLRRGAEADLDESLCDTGEPIFLSDKGELQIKKSDGEMAVFKNEDSTAQIYNLTENEFWDKYNAGELGTGFYNYESEVIETEVFSEALIELESPFIEHGDKTYIVNNYFGENSLTVIDKNGSVLGKYNVNEMLPSDTSSISFLIPYADMTKAFIGIDDTGYIYMNVEKAEGDVHSYGVISANISDISNPQSWSWITGIDMPLAFSSFNRLLPDIYSSSFVKNKHFNVDDGGIFAFQLNHTFVKEPFNSSGYNIDSWSGWTCKGGNICYLKNGQVVQWDSLANRNWRGGTMSFSVDKQNNIYTLALFCTATGTNDIQVGVKKISIDGTVKNYWIHVGDDLMYFDTQASLLGSRIFYKNNKVFIHIPNEIQSLLVLDLETETYSVSKQFSFNNPPSFINDITVTSAVDNGNSISYAIRRSSQYNDGTDETYLISWNYSTNTINLEALNTLTDNVSYSDVTNILKTDVDGNILFCIKENSGTNTMTAYNPDDLLIKYQVPLQDDISEEENKYYFFDKKQKTIIVIPYNVNENNTIVSQITIDEGGNVHQNSRKFKNLAQSKDMSTPIVPIGTDRYLLFGNKCCVCWDNSEKLLLGISNNYHNTQECYKTVIGSTPIFYFFDTPTLYKFKISGKTKKSSALVMNNKILLEDEGV